LPQRPLALPTDLDREPGRLRKAAGEPLAAAVVDAIHDHKSAATVVDVGRLASRVGITGRPGGHPPGRAPGALGRGNARPFSSGGCPPEAPDEVLGQPQPPDHQRRREKPVRLNQGSRSFRLSLHSRATNTNKAKPTMTSTAKPLARGLVALTFARQVAGESLGWQGGELRSFWPHAAGESPGRQAGLPDHGRTEQPVLPSWTHLTRRVSPAHQSKGRMANRTRSHFTAGSGSQPWPAPCVGYRRPELGLEPRWTAWELPLLRRCGAWQETTRSSRPTRRRRNRWLSTSTHVDSVGPPPIGAITSVHG
jgi:hypothetical protein